jgi:hypothetical protein
LKSSDLELENVSEASDRTSPLVPALFNPIPPPLPYEAEVLPASSDAFSQPTTGSGANKRRLSSSLRSSTLSPSSKLFQTPDERLIEGKEYVAAPHGSANAHVSNADVAFFDASGTDSKLNEEQEFLTCNGSSLDPKQTEDLILANSNNNQHPALISTQTTGIGRYTGGFNAEGQFHGQGTFVWIGARTELAFFVCVLRFRSVFF